MSIDEWVVVAAYYCQPWIRQQENPALSIRPDVWPTISPTVRGLVALAAAIYVPARRTIVDDPEANLLAHL